LEIIVTLEGIVEPSGNTTQVPHKPVSSLFTQIHSGEAAQAVSGTELTTKCTVTINSTYFYYIGCSSFPGKESAVFE
jgi:hypothetical protein